MSQNKAPEAQQRYLSRADLCARWNISRSTLFREERKGLAPRGIRVGPRRIRYLLSEVEDWERTWHGRRP
jgi:predicted DNA-binding transcriptional regulator AlpA